MHFRLRPSVRFFIYLLAAINFYLSMHHRLMPLVQAAILLNGAACGWFVWNAFAPPERAVAIRPGVRAMVIALLLTLDGVVFMGAYLRLCLSKHPEIILAAPAPAFNWTAFDGSAHTLSELSGRAAVLHFWGTWCVPCRKEFPKLVSYAKAHPQVSFLAIDTNDDAARADRFAENSGATALPNMFFARDTDGAIGDRFRPPGYPLTIFVDAQGVMRREFIGPIEWDGKADADLLKLQAR